MKYKSILFFFLSKANFYFELLRRDKISAKRLVVLAFEVEFAEEERKFLTLTHQYRKQYFDYSKGYYQKEGYLATFSNVSLLCNTGCIIVGRKIVIDSLYDEFRLFLSSSYRWPSFLRSRKVAGTCTSISLFPQGYNNVYHWLIDCLPRIYLLSMTGTKATIKVLINKDAPPYQKECLLFFTKLFPNFQIDYFHRREKLLISDFLFASYLSNHKSGYLPKEAISFIKKLLIDGYGIERTVNKRKIFISRKKTKKRRIKNEDEISAFLVGMGFEIIFSEDLAFKDQVELFSNSNFIISCHGAGLTNIMFSTESKILEIHPNNDVRSHYFLLSKACNHRYRYLLGRDSDQNEDFYVDLEEFKEVLNQF